MDTSHAPTRRRSYIEEIQPEECWELLATAPIGRLVWQGGEGLSVVTLNFTLDHRSILFRTIAYGTVARECDDSPVAFQVDHVDPDQRTGWSVLVRGHARLEYGDTVPIHSIDAWPEGSRVLPVRIEPGRITGRRLRPA